ncbi:MAG: DUF1800 family protein [Actinomycetota bacterium]|nr:DUF1800 family protein [Actinomycetota bacterium]
MNVRDEVVWLHRRAGFALAGAALDEAIGRGSAAELQRLLAPAAAAADPWDDALLPIDPQDFPSKQYAINRWVDTMVAAEQPLVERMAWIWHGHFVSALDKVRFARAMVIQVRLFRAAGLGPLRGLLRAVTVDPAMMLYLDLHTSTGTEPNENYARELLELFALGEGNYTEADVQAGAAALTGWTLERGEATVQFRPRRHDDSPQRYLGVQGVHDLDTVIDAVMGHASLPTWIAATLAWELLGTAPDDLVARLAEGFVQSGFDLRTLVGEVLQAGLDGATAPIVLAPVPWFVIASRATGAAPDRRTLALLRSAGQLPMLPPSVAGWPGGSAWFGSSSLVARADLAALMAATAPAGPVVAAAGSSDLQALADALGLPSAGFAAESQAALDAAPAGRDRLAVALLTPEFMIA